MPGWACGPRGTSGRAWSPWPGQATGRRAARRHAGNPAGRPGRRVRGSRTGAATSAPCPMTRSTRASGTCRVWRPRPPTSRPPGTPRPGPADTVIAVLDTGIRFEHPDLAARVLPGYDFVSEDSPTHSSAPTTATAGTATRPTRRLGLHCRVRRAAHSPAVDGQPQLVAWHPGGSDDRRAPPTTPPAIAGGTWTGIVLPVRVLGKCGGYDSDIVARHALGRRSAGHRRTRPTPTRPRSST